MPISPILSFFSEVADGVSPIPEGVYAYFRERQRNKLYDFIIRKFLEKENRGELNRADLARRLNKKPEQISRWLSAPSNWTLDTVSDFTLAVHGGELNLSVTPVAGMSPRNSSPLSLLNTSQTLSSSRTFVFDKPNVVTKQNSYTTNASSSHTNPNMRFDVSERANV